MSTVLTIIALLTDNDSQMVRVDLTDRSSSEVYKMYKVLRFKQFLGLFSVTPYRTLLLQSRVDKYVGSSYPRQHLFCYPNTTQSRSKRFSVLGVRHYSIKKGQIRLSRCRTDKCFSLGR